MPTKHPRIQVTLDKQMIEEVTQLALTLQQSVSGTLKELIAEALELREDLALSRLAEKLDKPNSKLVNHEQAWK